ncbi:MAG: crossover junction endodeoxyribonuclease RuvC, partial [Chitinophagales bacterium]
SITGSGNASKEQVSLMLQKMLALDTMPKYFDATDALGVAMCHHLQSKNPLFKYTKGKKQDWKAFLKDNPDRLKKH